MSGISSTVYFPNQVKQNKLLQSDNDDNWQLKFKSKILFKSFVF